MHYYTVRILIFLWLYLHSKIQTMRPTSEWKAPLQEDLKKQQQKKKISSKIGQCRPDLFFENRICFTNVV